MTADRPTSDSEPNAPLFPGAPSSGATGQVDGDTSRITRLDYGRHVRVLLVEADSEVAEAFVQAGHESVLDVRVEVVDDPGAAIARLERSNAQRRRKPLPDIIVTSVAVPEAHRLLEMLQDDSQFDGIPVLVLAPSASAQAERRSFALGAVAHLVAPTRDYERVALMHALPDFIPRARAAHAHLESHRR